MILFIWEIDITDTVWHSTMNIQDLVVLWDKILKHNCRVNTLEWIYSLTMEDISEN